MAAFNPGTGGDLKSTTLEAALLEVAQKLQVEEAAETEPTDNVSISVDADTAVATLSITLPISITVDSSGKLVVQANPFTS